MEETVTATTDKSPVRSAKRTAKESNSKYAKKKKAPVKISAAVTAAKERANQMFSSASSVTAADENSGESRSSQKTPRDLEMLSQFNSPSSFSSSELLKLLEEQKKEIEELQSTLKQQSGH